MFPKIDKDIQLDKDNFHFEQLPSPKLIKFGFNSINNETDLVELTKVPQYRTGLDVDFERADEQSFRGVASKYGITNFAESWAVIWEIIVLFGLANTDQKIYTDDSNLVKNISAIASKTGFNGKLTRVKTDSTLAINRYSDIEIDENAAISFIINSLPKLLLAQKKESNMIIQIFGTQTMTMAEIIYYLSILYNEAYLVKPSISSNLSSEKYLVLINLKSVTTVNVPKHNPNLYLSSVGISNIDPNFINIIQCYNSETIPKKYQIYALIKDYLNTKVYEGSRYREFIDIQNTVINQWFNNYYDNPQDAAKITDAVIKKSSETCISYDKLANILS